MAIHAMAASSASFEDKVASRAVAGVGDEVRRGGGSTTEGDAIEVALKFVLLGDEDRARRALRHGFDDKEIEAILFELQKGVMEAA